jgi:hypothetical protein
MTSGRGRARLALAVACALLAVAGALTAASPAVAADPPTVTSVAPNAGPVSGGNQVVIYGSGYTDVTSVRFGSTRAKFVVQDVEFLTSIVATAPMHGAGRTDITVTTADGTSAVVANTARYTYIAAPRALHVHAAETIDSIDPSIPVNLISCASSTFCAAFDADGRAVMYYDSRWHRPVEIDGQLQSISSLSCTSSTFCLAATTGGEMLRWNGSGTGWTDAPNTGAMESWSISCVTSTFCEGVDVTGYASTFNGTSWTSPSLVDPDDEVATLASVSCPTTAFCYAAGNTSLSGGGQLQQGAVIPMVNGTWNDPEFIYSHERLSVISCPQIHFCAVGGNYGVHIWTGQVGDILSPVGWSNDIALHADAAATTVITSLDCTNATFCVAYWQTYKTGIKHWARFDGASTAAQSFPVTEPGTFPTAVSCWSRYACQFVGGSLTRRTS